MNPNKKIRIEKVTVNISAGKDQTKLGKGQTLIKHITGIEPIKTVTMKRIASWGLRPGLPIGVKVTMRNKKAEDMLNLLLQAKKNTLHPKQIDHAGNVSFGIPEYIDIPNIKYLPEIGIMGLEVCITLERPGYRVKRRRLKKAKVAKQHLISKEESMQFFKDNFKVQFGEERQ